MKKIEDILAFMLIAFSLLGCFAPVLFYAVIPVALATVVETLFFDTEYEPMITFTEMLVTA